MKNPVIIWFRQDLRLADNPALNAAVETDHPVLPVYILDDESAGEHAMGGASRWWLHHSLLSLNHSLGGHLRVKRGNAEAGSGEHVYVRKGASRPATPCSASRFTSARPANPPPTTTIFFTVFMI